MSLKYRPEIDGLRAVSVLAVILYHAGFTYQDAPLFKGGFIGVDIFFVISGYLITSIILGEVKEGKFSFFRFYERRVRRILPALFVVVAVSSLFAWAYLIPDRMVSFGKSLISSLFFFANHYFLSEEGYFDVQSVEKPLLHTWSLSVEEQFYIVFPIVILLVWKFARNYVLYLFVFGFYLSLQVAHYSSYTFPDAAFYLLPTRGWELLGGAILAKLELDKGRIGNPYLREAAPVLGLVLIVGSVIFFDNEMLHPSFWTVFPVAGAMMFVWFARSGEGVAGVIGSKPLVGIGLMSYSLYLWHFPVFAFAEMRDGVLSQLDRLGVVALSLVMAFLTYGLVEKPFRKREFITLRTASMVLVTCFAGLLIFSVAAIQTKGFKSRFDPRDLQFVDFDRKELSRYVWSRFKELNLAKFDSGDDRKKLLIIGDSYGQDLVNMLYEVGVFNKIQISTYFIGGRCGNLFLNFDFSEEIPWRHRNDCKNAERYENQKLRLLMKEADIIWLASSWKSWQVEYLLESLQNIKAETAADILILGRKSFGEINLNELKETPIESRHFLRNPSPDGHLAVNRAMKDLLSSEKFIDLHRLICGDGNTCPVFDDELLLISFDGYHLTKAGARYVGSRLIEHPFVSDIFGNGSG